MLGRLFRTGDDVPWGGNTGSGGAIVLSYCGLAAFVWRRFLRHRPAPRVAQGQLDVDRRRRGAAGPRLSTWCRILDRVGVRQPRRRRATRRERRPKSRGRISWRFLQNDPDQARFFGANTVGAQVHTLDANGDGRCAAGAARALSGGDFACSRSRVRTSGTCCCCARRDACASCPFVAQSARRRRTSRGILLAESVVLAIAGGALGVGSRG